MKSVIEDMKKEVIGDMYVPVWNVCTGYDGKNAEVWKAREVMNQKKNE